MSPISSITPYFAELSPFLHTQKNLKDTERLKEEFDKRGVLLQEYQNKVESLGLELTQTSLSKAKSEERFSTSGQDNLVSLDKWLVVRS